MDEKDPLRMCGVCTVAPRLVAAEGPRPDEVGRGPPLLVERRPLQHDVRPDLPSAAPALRSSYLGNATPEAVPPRE